MLERFQAFVLAQQFFQSCETLRIPEFFRDQLYRGSASIALNLAEGWDKKSTKDREKYFTNALGSLRECQAILMMTAPKRTDLLEQADQLGAVIYTLMNRPRPGRPEPT